MHLRQDDIALLLLLHRDDAGVVVVTRMFRDRDVGLLDARSF